MSSSQTVWGDTGVSAINIGSIALNSPNNGRVDDGSCAYGTYLSSGNVGLRIQIIDPSMPNNPTTILAKVEMRLNEAASGGLTSNIKIRRSGQSNCAGHNLNGSSGGTCASTTWSGWVTCTHSQRPRTIAEAKGTVTIEWLKGVFGFVDNSNHDGVEVRYTYEIWGAPAAPTVAGYAVGKLRVTKGASPSNATHWNVWRSTTSGGSYSLVSSSYIPVGTTTWDDNLNHGDGVTRYYKLKYSASSDGDFSSIGNYGSGTTWDVPSAPTWAGTKFTARTTSSITFDWVTPGDDGGTAITEYWYDWKVNGGGYATVDTNSTNTIATKSTLSGGTKYWFKVLARNAIGSSPFTSEEFHWTMCATPSAPTVTANAVGSLRIQHLDVTGIDKWRVMRSATSGGSYSQVYLSGAGATALDWSDTGEGNGVTWYYKLYARNIDGNDSGLGTYTSGTTWNVPSTSSDPTLNADGVGDITGTKPSSPANNGSTITHWQYQVDNDSGFGSIDYNSGDIVIGTSTDQATGLSNGVVYYAQVRFKNAVGYSAAWSVGSVNETTWDVPDAQDLVLADNSIEDSMIRITRNGSYPNGNGESVDSWEVWRSATSGSGYTELIAGLTITTYDDWSVNGDETWYYKAKFTNLVGDSVISTGYVNATAIEADITMFSNTRIQQYERDSEQITRIVQRDDRISEQITRIVQLDNRIFEQVTKTVQIATKISVSISKLMFILQEIPILSDTTVERIREISRVSNTRIFNVDREITVISDSAIYREGFNSKQASSISDIKRTFKSTTVLDTRIKNTYKVIPPIDPPDIESDSTIFTPSWGDKQLTSNERIVEEGTIVVPPVYSDTRIKSIGIEVLSSELTWNEFRSDTFIVLGQEISKLSNTAIFIAEYGLIEPLSNTAIFRDSYDTKTTLSDTAIYESGIELTKLSDTIIFRPGGYKYPFQKVRTDSDSRIKNVHVRSRISNSVIFVNDLEFTKISETLIIHQPDITKLSDSWIEILDIKLITSTVRIKISLKTTKISDGIIKRYDFDTITKLSDTIIHREPTISIDSNSLILILFELDKTSDTHIINKDVEITTNSDSTIFNTSYGNIEKESQAVIKNLNYKTIRFSDTRIKITIIKNILSDISIRRNRSNLKIIFQKSRQL